MEEIFLYRYSAHSAADKIRVHHGVYSFVAEFCQNVYGNGRAVRNLYAYPHNVSEYGERQLRTCVGIRDGYFRVVVLRNVP